MELLALINIPIWLLGIVVFIVSLFLYSKWKLSYWKREGVPGPPPTPFLGSLGMIKKKILTEKVKSSDTYAGEPPPWSLQTKVCAPDLPVSGLWGADLEYRRKYGKIYGTYFGHIPQINVADPEIVKELLIKDFSSYPNRFAPVDPTEEQRGMLTKAVDEHWKFMRNTLTATFSSGKMRLTSPAVADCCEKLVENIKEQSKDGKEVIEIKHIFGCLTMDVIASTGFGIDVNSQKDPNNEFVKQAKKVCDFRFTSPVFMLLMIFPNFAKFWNFLSSWKVTKNAFTDSFIFFKKVTLSVMEERKSGNYQKRKDFMQIMVNAHKEAVDTEDKANMVDYKEGDAIWRNRGLTVDEITANSFLFFLAGYDTTANTMSFLAYNLAMHPECQEKCIEEVDRVLGKDKPNYDNVLKLQYLENCMNETLRIYGPASFLNRHVTEDCKIAGYNIPKNSILSIPIYAIHHDPEYWPEPEKFDPDRVLPEEKVKRHPYAFLPFGHGPRNCIGMRLAQLEAKAAIASILQKYRLVKCDETEDPVIIDVSSGLLRAKNGIKLKVESRA